jgi:myo-inositol-1-phosphate synthase
MAKTTPKIKPAKGKLGVLLPGMGAVATTFIAGVEAIRKGVAKPIGSLTQMGTIRLGKRTDGRTPMIKDFVDLAGLDDIQFAGWDIFEDNCYEAACKAGVLERELLDQIKDRLEQIKPMPAVFDKRYVKKLDGPNVKKGGNWWEMAEQLKADIENFKKEKQIDRLVMVWCGSTEIYMQPKPVHQTIQSFEEGLRNNDPDISPSMVYAYAAISSRIPYANGAPNLSGDIPALVELARELRVPICGKDFKTGQTLMKTILAPGFKARMLGLNGWFSTNILGNRDGEVLESIPICTKTCTTRSGSTTTRLGGTTKRDGIILTYSAGWGTPCR